MHFCSDVFIAFTRIVRHLLLRFLYNALYIDWQWRTFFIPVYASCSGRHDAGQWNVNILQHLQSDH